jgi:hypothetical protein
MEHRKVSPVSSFNEWDPLEEVIVGRIDGAAFPAWRTINEHTVPPGDWDRIEAAVGTVGAPYPRALVDAVDYARPFVVAGNEIIETPGTV